jgi:hypothetical protein
MKYKFISLVLIMALSFQCLIKIGLISYYSINIEYIIAELCENKDKPELKCNGKCYLKKKMGEADKAEKQTAGIFKQIEFPVFIPHVHLSIDPKYILIENTIPELKNFYSHTLSNKIFHPPLV